METLIHLVNKVGYVGIFTIVFLESSLPITFFLPGDSLLFVTGFLASKGNLSFPLLVITIFSAGVLGYLFGYVLGRKIGERLFNNEHSFWFNPKRLEYTHEFMEKYGIQTILFSRFVPVVRSFAPTIAGAGQMKYKRFVVYTLIGGAAWAGGVTAIGYYLGRAFPEAHVYLTPLILLVVFISIIPTIIEYFYHKRKKGKVEKEDTKKIS